MFSWSDISKSVFGLYISEVRCLCVIYVMRYLKYAVCVQSYRWKMTHLSEAVSYTHLDVYKRQGVGRPRI